MNVHFMMIFVSVCITHLPWNIIGSSLRSDNTPFSKTLENWGEIIRHRRRKGMRSMLGRGLRRRHKEGANAARRYLEKQLLVYNRTIALLGDEVEKILHSTREFKMATSDETPILGLSYIAKGKYNEENRKENSTSGNQSISMERGFSAEVEVQNYSNDELESDPSRFYESGDSSLTDEELQIGFGHALEHLLKIMSNVSVKHNSEYTPCQQWTNCKKTLQDIFLGPLPACPCDYPNGIFYDNKIWDNFHQRFFRWKDASGDNERLDIYKPGAEYCIRSLLGYRSTTLSAQHCCYDRHRKLITRGSGAGNPNFVSPDVSATLHYKLDILPWRICKGDFTRYNRVRPPNNSNSCPGNPDAEEYKKQVERATSF